MAVGILACRFVNRIGLVSGVAVAVGMCVGTSAALAGPTGHTSGRVAFYGDVGNPVNSPYSKNPLEVRPARLLLAEDGSAALLGLHWRGWGSKVARATGVLSASTCTPNCATGARTTSPARLTLSSPGRVFGHEVYRCFQVAVPSHPQSNMHDCLEGTGNLIGYSPVSKASPATTTTARTPPLVRFYSGQGWFCDMAADGVNCENPKGYTAHLSPNGKVTICTAGIAACKVGSPKYMPSTLVIGKQVTVKPFRCRETAAGLTCTVIATGHGFRLDTTTATRVG